MTTFFTEDLTGTGPFGTFDLGTSFVVMPNVSLIATAGHVFDSVAEPSALAMLLVLGTVASGSGATIFSRTSAFVTIGATGSVIGSGGGAIALHDSGRVINEGWIGSEATSTTLSMYGNFGIVENSGTITGRIGVEMSGLGVSLANEGQIFAGYNNFTAYGVFMGNAFGAHLANSGLISVQGNALSAGVQLSVVGMTLTNSGTIRCLQGWGIACGSSVEPPEVLILTNRGTIQGNLGVTGSIRCDDADDRITNTGHLIGDVVLGGGNDLFDTIGGRLTGAVLGGAGDDVFRVDSALIQIVETGDQGIDRIETTADYSLAALGAVENLTLIGRAAVGEGNSLANAIIGNTMDNVLYGLIGNDTLTGGAGRDRLDGGGGNDQMAGGQDDDTLLGRAADDVIDGGSGEDRLAGGEGRDGLSGGDGDDTVIGGGGRDTLTGGADRDSFVFHSILDSGAGNQRDTLADFAAGEDVIDLSAVDARAGAAGDQAFAFIGTGAFTGKAGELRFDATGPNGLLQGDVNGDGVADFELVLTGVTVLAVGDLVL